jgi:hypothetical protein
MVYAPLLPMEFKVQQAVEINAQPSDVWSTLNKREMIFDHFLGGLKNDDPSLEGVLERLPQKFLNSLNLYQTFRMQDKHHRIIYYLEAYDGLTTIRIIHENIESEKTFRFLDQAWMNLLKKVKQSLED